MSFNIFAMPSSSILLLLSAAYSISNALPWAPAQETKVYRADAWTPAPTAIPVVPADLFKRSVVDVNICGWIGGNSAVPAVCSVGSSCVRDFNHGYVGCCTTEGPCTQGVYTSCVDKNSVGWSPNAGLQNNGIYTCGGSDVCYRNTYPGGYYQYGCGSSNFATNVETTYSGQPVDVKLQQVFTGVQFTPTSANTDPTTLTRTPTKASQTKPTSQSASTSNSISGTSTSQTSSPLPISSTSASSSSSTAPSQTLAVAGNVTPTNTSATPNAAQKSNTGKAIGASVGGTIAVAALALLIFLLCRRRRRNQQKTHRAGSFVSRHNTLNGKPPTSGPFQRIQPYGPDDFSPPQPFQYAAVPATHNQDSQNFFQALPPRSRGENDPLVGSEIDDFSRGFHDALAEHEDGVAQRDTHIHTGQLPDTVAGLGLGVGTAPPISDGSSEYSDQTRVPSDSFHTRQEGWTPQRLRTRGENGYGTGNGDGDVGLRGGEGGNHSPEIDIPPKSPLRGGGVGIGRRSAGRSARDNRPRYQLVDEVLDENVPILHSPGQLRNSRAQSKDISKE